MGLRYCPKTTSGPNIFTHNDCWDKLQTQLQTANQGSNTIITKLKRSVFGSYLFYFQKMKMSEKVATTTTLIDNRLTCRRTDGGKNIVGNKQIWSEG